VAIHFTHQTKKGRPFGPEFKKEKFHFESMESLWKTRREESYYIAVHYSYWNRLVTSSFLWVSHILPTLSLEKSG
jgi:hypothetical protein